LFFYVKRLTHFFSMAHSLWVCEPLRPPSLLAIIISIFFFLFYMYMTVYFFCTPLMCRRLWIFFFILKTNVTQWCPHTYNIKAHTRLHLSSPPPLHRNYFFLSNRNGLYTQVIELCIIYQAWGQKINKNDLFFPTDQYFASCVIIIK